MADDLLLHVKLLRMADRLELDEHEIVVLNHVLEALTNRTDFDALVPDPADRQALDNLVCVLERENPHVFGADYDEHLERARQQLSAGR